MVEVEWKRRYDNTKPNISPYPAYVLKHRYSDLLIKYFEDKYI